MPRLIKAALEKAEVTGATSGVDVIGDIAIVRLPHLSTSEKKRVAISLIDEMKNVKVVLEQEGGIEGEYRLRKLRHLAGEKRTKTIHRENGCSFKVDVARCYFSPRLSTERLRIATGVKKNEKVLNMFAGVGPFSIVIAREAGAKVVSCELNGVAAKLHVENDALNKVADRVKVINVDAHELPELLKSRFHRILMPHPAEADKFLPVALRLAKKGGTIHYYRHVLGQDEAEAAEGLRMELSGLLPFGATHTARRVREVGPRWVEMAAEIRVPD